MIELYYIDLGMPCGSVQQANQSYWVDFGRLGLFLPLISKNMLGSLHAWIKGLANLDPN